MRFVKGDAIAAIVIVVINLIGGLVIGVGSRGLSAGAGRADLLAALDRRRAWSRRSRRCSSRSRRACSSPASRARATAALGEDLGVQLGGQPRALAGAAILLIGLGARARAAAGAVPRARRWSPPALALLAARAQPRAAVALDEPGAADVRGPRLSLRLAPSVNLPSWARRAPRRGHREDAACRSRRSRSRATARSPPTRSRSRSTARRSRG